MMFYCLFSIFVSGFCCMALEIAAGRLLAVYFGNTVFLWTGVISAFLISMTAGYFLGGKLFKDNFCIFSGNCFTISGVFMSAAMLFQNFLREYSFQMGIRGGPFLAALCLFGIPVMLISAVSPAGTASLSRRNSDKIAFYAGVCSVFQAAGSLCGALLTGFYLLQNLGISKTVAMCSMIVLFTGISGLDGIRKKVCMILLFVPAFQFYKSPASEKGEIFRRENMFHTVSVRESKDKKALHLYLDSWLENGMFKEDDRIFSSYVRSCFVIPESCQKGNALIIGAGAFEIPKYLAKNHQNLEIEVAEIDPELELTGKQFFGLLNYPEIKRIYQDGRWFLLHTEKKYNLIFSDACSGLYQIPEHLLSLEFFTLVHEHLQKDGIFMLNLISSEKGKLFLSVNQTLQQVFKNTAAFFDNPDSDEIQNIVLFCSDTALPQGLIPLQSDSSQPIITDDLCPLFYAAFSGSSGN